MRFWGVDEDAVRSSGKFLRRYAVGFRRVFVLIPGDVPEVSGEDDRLEFRSGIHFYAAQRASDFKMYGLVFTCK